MLTLLQISLQFFARRILQKYSPVVIGVTGSVGKTSTVEAIQTILSKKFTSRKSLKNYNNELGLPLSIIGGRAYGKNLIGWIGVMLKALRLLLLRDRSYPAMLVLEMGADRPGDIKALTELAPCHIGVLTAVGPAHLELFGSIDRVLREKQVILTHLKKDDIAVYNADDSLIAQASEKIRSRHLTFGFSEQATVRATEMQLSTGTSADPWVDQQVKGMSFKLIYQGTITPVFLPSALGQQQVYCALAAISVGLAVGMNMADIAQSLRGYTSPPGRMRLLGGIKHTSIIDDSYNSSPLATKAALRVLGECQVSGRKWAILGDMLELGAYTETGHREVGQTAATIVDFLVTVGERSRHTADAATQSGLPEQAVFTFGDADSAGRFVQDRLRPGDIMLIKGSQGMRMERVVKELMAEPLQAEQLLVRQGKEWINR